MILVAPSVLIKHNNNFAIAREITALRRIASPAGVNFSVFVDLSLCELLLVLLLLLLFSLMHRLRGTIHSSHFMAVFVEF
jgi:hypothetical protein